MIRSSSNFRDMQFLGYFFYLCISPKKKKKKDCWTFYFLTPAVYRCDKALFRASFIYNYGFILLYITAPVHVMSSCYDTYSDIPGLFFRQGKFPLASLVSLSEQRLPLICDACPVGRALALQKVQNVWSYCLQWSPSLTPEPTAGNMFTICCHNL